MKQLTRSLGLKTFLTMFLLAAFQTIMWAQDAGGTSTDVKITTDSGNWYSRPWVWIIGAIIFIILLVALMGGGSSRTTVVRDGAPRRTVTRTTTVDDDVDVV
ncbi:MAG: hypothetical protein JWN76_878 [Chitinophagaceae bacterium]|nr:hypothetical protein [Chitinophagaceae bacterium]